MPKGYKTTKDKLRDVSNILNDKIVEKARPNLQAVVIGDRLFVRVVEGDNVPVIYTINRIDDTQEG